MLPVAGFNLHKKARASGQREMAQGSFSLLSWLWLGALLGLLFHRSERALAPRGFLKSPVFFVLMTYGWVGPI
jgi:hypothetical protein